ncbi:unnamed protein product [Boreogadus saida]
MRGGSGVCVCVYGGGGGCCPPMTPTSPSPLHFLLLLLILCARSSQPNKHSPPPPPSIPRGHLSWRGVQQNGKFSCHFHSHFPEKMVSLSRLSSGMLNEAVRVWVRASGLGGTPTEGPP